MRPWLPIRNQYRHQWRCLVSESRQAVADILASLNALMVPVRIVLLIAAPVTGPLTACLGYFRDSRDAVRIVRGFRKGASQRAIDLLKKRAFVFPRARVYRVAIKASDHHDRRWKAKEDHNGGR